MSDSMKIWCRYFTGIQNETCKKGIRYVDVRDDSGPGMYKWPCCDPGAKTTCPLYEHHTQEEIDERDRAVTTFVNAINALTAGETDICPHCGKQITWMRQVRRCVYASCGCRLWQGKVPDAWKDRERKR